MSQQPSKKQPGAIARLLDTPRNFVDTVRTRLSKKRQPSNDTKPHVSFRLSRRRDYVRSLSMPGYVRFTVEVTQFLWSRRGLFGRLALLYGLIVIVAGGIASQDSYMQIQSLAESVTAGSHSVNQGLGSVTNAGTILFSSLGGATLTEVQQIYLALALVLVWLTTVWLLRELMAGRNPNLRDGLYNAGSPLLSTGVLVLVFLLQLVPFAISALIYAALASVGLASEGFGAMIGILGVALVGALTLYWLTSTFISLIIVTLPGMYPVRALRAAGNLVVSRRLRIMYRLLWMLAVSFAAWAIVMIPLIMMESWIRDSNEWLSSVPTIPVAITAMSTITMIWITGYVYLMYRKLVDDDSTPG